MLNNKSNAFILCLISSCSFDLLAAVRLDRTRLIFPSDESSVTIKAVNASKSSPYLLKSWIENAEGKKIGSPFTIAPALQRIEPLATNLLRVNALIDTDSLPKDRESLFWFNIQEIPQVHELQGGGFQFAQKTRIKMFWRPASLENSNAERWEDLLTLQEQAGGFVIHNPTPFYITVTSIKNSEKSDANPDIRATMIAPKSEAFMKSERTLTPHVTTINDYGALITTRYTCERSTCIAKFN